MSKGLSFVILIGVAKSLNADSPELQRLAAIATHFLVLRAGHVLQRYISVSRVLHRLPRLRLICERTQDQPLRGRMPQPVCQRKEMLYMLQCLVKLESGSETVHTGCPVPSTLPCGKTPIALIR